MAKSFGDREMRRSSVVSSMIGKTTQPSTPEKGKRGRPPAERVNSTIRLTEPTREKLKILAFVQKKPMSFIVEEILCEYFESSKAKTTIEMYEELFKD